jgi:hypothetical protein
VQQVEGIQVKDQVKYLGMLITSDRQKLRKTVDIQIRKNIQYIRWRLRGANTQVMETLVNGFARSLLIYLGTPMVAAGLWNVGNIETKEKSILKESMLKP